MPGIFRFKQFNLDQTGCAMKINTDGVLLGVLATVDQPKTILDIGTGTGVIALMLAQRFIDSQIEAVEIDQTAAETAQRNFEGSPFADRLSLYADSFEHYLNNHSDRKYDLIISNPPFHINSLESPGDKKSLAKHTDEQFFKNLVKSVAEHLTEQGSCWLILPLKTAELVKVIADKYGLYLNKKIAIKSFETSAPHREIVCMGWNKIPIEISSLVIYESVGNYSITYKQLLQPYFIAF
jgi:tRNA1Val (adenine37-N6)-methyltransferase